jgi:hypothetical protein
MVRMGMTVLMACSHTVGGRLSRDALGPNVETVGGHKYDRIPADSVITAAACVVLLFDLHGRHSHSQRAHPVRRFFGDSTRSVDLQPRLK